MYQRDGADKAYLLTGNNEESASHWENKYRDLYSVLDSGFCVIEMQFDVTGRPCDYVYKELNAHFEAQSGLKDVLGRRALEVLPDHGQEWFDIYGRIAMTGVSERFENRIDAIGRWYEILAFRIGQPEQRQVGVLFNDIDTRKRAELALQASEARQSFLLKLGDELRPVSDAATIQQIASQRLAEFLKADRVGYAEDDGNTGEVVVTHDHARTIANIEGRHLYESFGADLLATLRAGRPVIHNDISDDPLLTDVEKQAYDLLGIGAVLNVPLLKDGALEAILFVHYQRPHVFSEAEVALAWEVGERTWAEVMRARTETALKDSKASLAAVFESLPVGAGLFDAASGRMVLANAAMKPYLPTGAMPSRDAERGWRWEAWDAQGNPVPREQFPGARALRGEHVVPGMEMLYTSDSGENMWTSVSAVPVRDERGQITGQVGVIMDIDAIKRTEASLRDAEARWRILTDAMPHLVWIAEAREAGSIYVNDRFASYTGQTSAQLLGFRWMKSIHPDDVESVKSAWLNLPDDEEGFEVEFRLRRHDGVYRWFLGRVVPAPLTDGNGQQWIGVCADIQSLMEARFQAEAADRAKSEFLANISHEIRTPLNAIVGLTSILTSPHSNPSMYPKYFRTMQDSSNALHELINDILEFSRLDADMVELSETEFALSDLLGEVERISAVKADAKGLSLGIQDFTGQTRLYVADGHRIKQILLNLMSNAVKFTHKGSVNLMVSEGASIDGRETLTFCVRDTGIGIASDKLEAIFEKFTQVDGSYSRRFGGTGLGLAISKRLAQTMGGTLRVESELGEGAAFLLTVPVSYLSGPADGASSDGVMGNVKAETASLQHALLVEDNPVNAMVAETMLQKLGCTFETANTGFAAIEKWRQGDFDIILLDLQMPDMDGLTVARRIRQMEREAGARPVKIVALTAHAFTNDREKALSAGMDGYLTKPYTIHSLSQVLS